jgi:hypothetical protein
MIGIAFCRKPLRVFVSFALGRRALGRSDRGGQDKARKVRAVGCSGIASKFKHAQDIAPLRSNLRFSAPRCSCSSFHTLRQA